MAALFLVELWWGQKEVSAVDREYSQTTDPWDHSQTTNTLQLLNLFLHVLLHLSPNFPNSSWPSSVSSACSPSLTFLVSYKISLLLSHLGSGVAKWLNGISDHICVNKAVIGNNSNYCRLSPWGDQDWYCSQKSIHNLHLSLCSSSTFGTFDAVTFKWRKSASDAKQLMKYDQPLTLCEKEIFSA